MLTAYMVLSILTPTSVASLLPFLLPFLLPKDEYVCIGERGSFRRPLKNRLQNYKEFVEQQQWKTEKQ